MSDHPGPTSKKENAATLNPIERALIYLDAEDEGALNLQAARKILHEALLSQSPVKPEPRGDALSDDFKRRLKEDREALQFCHDKGYIDPCPLWDWDKLVALASLQGQGDASCVGCIYTKDASGGSCNTCSRSWIGIGSDHYKPHPQQDGLREALVDKITDSLMTNGFGKRATRLQLRLAGEIDGGGYCEDMVRQIIRAALAQADRRPDFLSQALNEGDGSYKP